MSRQSKGTRLELYKRQGRTTMWVVRDGQRMHSTGCPESDRAGAERALADYIASKYDPKASRRGGDPNAILVADALNVYMTEHVPTLANPDAEITRLENLGAFFGAKKISQLNGAL